MHVLQSLNDLSHSLDGELLHDDITRAVYSTDASVYSEKPVAVAWPANGNDIRKLLAWCRENGTGLTIRAAGTSLAGQAVGSGIVADISRHMTRILEFNAEEKWVDVEPGVVSDELNIFLRPHGLFFAPETSSSNRCTIGGMTGNNACGLHSLIYGSVRDHLIELSCILSDGSDAVFRSVSRNEFNILCKKEGLEGKIYRNIRDILSDPSNSSSICREYPHKEINRRNTGYCLDILLDTDIFSNSSKTFNLASLLAGSEGTLAVITRIKLNLLPLPPPCKGLLCVHLKERSEAFRANLTALRHKPSAVEMMDNKILELTVNNLSQRNNRFFISGEPGAVLIVELTADSDEELNNKASLLTQSLKDEGYGYHYPLITGSDIGKVWALRKAGLGILSNMTGDAKPVSLIEDTAVRPVDLPAYMDELTALLGRHEKDVVLHAHIGTGELHVRPILNLRNKKDRELFRQIGLETTGLVKKYRGSLSGEHGDGRLRSEFIPLLLGDKCYSLIRSVKETWDPHNILNPGVIVNPQAVNSGFRYEPGNQVKETETIMDFSDAGGIIRAAEKCNGSADCRKSALIGGVMCPSYMATRDERLSTRARANILRQYLPATAEGNWDIPEIADILDLCLSCKGCKAECPSGVDIAKIRAEFLQHWNDIHGISLRTWLIANISSIYSLGSGLPSLFNFMIGNRFISGLIKKLSGFAPGRSIPRLQRVTFRKWLRKNLHKINPPDPVSEVCLFVDEFTNYNDTPVGIKAVQLLTRLNYRVTVINSAVSGRAYISKGFLRRASGLARRNVALYHPFAAMNIPVVGIEPSAILGFRDEYPDLVGNGLKQKAIELAGKVMTIDEFLAGEHRAGRIDTGLFDSTIRNVVVHVHCQQKALCGSGPTIAMLSIPAGYRVKEIASGCCGMAGSFGYEKEHYDLSNKIGELVLFPAVRSCVEETIISAPGTSCRHHIYDGTGRRALHPVEVLHDALITR